MMAGLMRLRLDCLLVPLLGALVPGCDVWSPQMHPLDPPPNIAPGQELIVIPDDMVEALGEPETLHVREAELQAVAEGRRSAIEPKNKDAVREHRILTGMTVQEVILAVGSHPTAVKDQGPPGGHTLLWEPPSWKATRRFWVRFDEWGHSAAAGTH
jgi:hypothetical protein